MRPDLRMELEAGLRRIDMFMERSAAMLALGTNGSDLPRELEFTEQELRSIDEMLTILATKLTKTPTISKDLWTPPVRYAYDYRWDNKPWGQWTWLEGLHKGLKASYQFFSSYLDSRSGGTTYNIENSNGSTFVINQDANIQFVDWTKNDKTEFANLIQELKLLREAMKRESQIAEQDLSIGAIAAAEVEAKKGNAEAVLHYLKQAGTWAFDVATKIGVSVASEAIKASMK